jgi:Fur family peroxide stress response transcriptional regulator
VITIGWKENKMKSVSAPVKEKASNALVQFQDLLNSKGVKPSYQRLLILEYIMNKKNHPSAEMIYSNISREIPTLSRTTVYNTLNLFAQKGILTNLKIDDSEARYDLLEKPHAHFHCSVCEKIIDLDLKTPLYSKDSIDGHKAKEVHIHFNGVCKDCMRKRNE